MSKESNDMAIEQAEQLRRALVRLAKWEGYEGDRDNPRTPWESNPWCWVIDVEGVKA